ncbi:endonuclease/exonuclease/phosphatase family protein [Thermoproteota archaeon]
MNLRICNWNTNYWQQRKTYQKIWDYIYTELKPDILLLQEATQPENIHHLKHSAWIPVGGTRDWGSGIWSRYPYSVKRSHYLGYTLYNRIYLKILLVGMSYSIKFE